MDDEWVTAAVIGDQTQAEAARIHLEEAGIPVFVADDLVANTLFVAGAAGGGVKLQVPASRLEEALRLIDDRLPGHAGPVDWSQVDVGRPDPDEVAEAGEEPAEPAVAPAPPPAGPDEVTEPTDLTLREQRANKIVRGALIGILVGPVWVLAVWRLIQIANSEERLRPEYQRKANLATWIVAVPLGLLLLACCIVPIVLSGR